MSFVDFIFPKMCLGCGMSGCYVCTSCLSKMTSAKEICPGCGKYSFCGKTHLICKNRCDFDGLVLVWVYEGVVRKALIQLKYRFSNDLVRELVEGSSVELVKKTKDWGGCVLVPVPLEKGRERWRGFNQTEEMGRVLARKMGWEYSELLCKTKKTKTQVGLKGKEREENVRDAFLTNKKLTGFINKNKRYVIFDDVWTTGNTLKECAKALKKEGIKSVWGLVVCG